MTGEITVQDLIQVPAPGGNYYFIETFPYMGDHFRDVHVQLPQLHYVKVLEVADTRSYGSAQGFGTITIEGTLLVKFQEKGVVQTRRGDPLRFFKSMDTALTYLNAMLIDLADAYISARHWYQWYSKELEKQEKLNADLTTRNTRHR